MKPRFLAPLAFVAASYLVTLAAPSTAHAQLTNNVTTLGGPTTANAQIVPKAITVSLPKTPEFTTLGGEGQAKRYTLGTWAEIEVEFSCSARTAEVPMKMSVLINGQNLVGEQTLIDVPAGQSLFTVMYIAPRPLATALKGAALTPNSIQNVAVQFSRAGVAAPVATKMLRDGQPFFNTMQQIPNFVLPKNGTPFAPLYWDRYEQIKPVSNR